MSRSRATLWQWRTGMRGWRYFAAKRAAERDSVAYFYRLRGTGGRALRDWMVEVAFSPVAARRPVAIVTLLTLERCADQNRTHRVPIHVGASAIGAHFAQL